MKLLIALLSAAIMTSFQAIELNLKEPMKPENLMIVAHPDDEILWGGDELRKKDYVVVCLTNRDNEIRRKEFFAVMNKSHDQGIMLSYPDKVNGKRSRWKKEKRQIEKVLNYIIHSKKWKRIVTHNPDGEYGHIHHQMTSRMVTSIVNENGYQNLYYFNHYMKKSELEKKKKAYSISDEGILWKDDMMKLYSSQHKVDEKLKHMYGYEKMIPQKKWKTK